MTRQVNGRFLFGESQNLAVGLILGLGINADAISLLGLKQFLSIGCVSSKKVSELAVIKDDRLVTEAMTGRGNEVEIGRISKSVTT